MKLTQHHLGLCTFLGLAVGWVGSSALGCASMLGVPSVQQMQAQSAQAQADAMKANDDRAKQQLENARTKAKAAPGGVDEARVFAQNLQGLFQIGAIERQHLDGSALVDEALGYLDAANAKSPDKGAEVLFSKGALLLAANRAADGVKALRGSMDAKPSAGACSLLVSELDKQGETKEIIPLCQKALPGAQQDEESRYGLLKSCSDHGHQGLEWAGPENTAFFREYEKKIAEENAAHRAEKQAQLDAMYAEFDRHSREDAQKQAAKKQCLKPCEREYTRCDRNCGHNGRCISDCNERKRECESDCR